MLTDESKKLLLNILEKDEGYRQYAYDDATGQRVLAPKGNMTIGIGFNIENGCPISLARMIGYYFIEYNEYLLTSWLKIYPRLDQVHKIVLGNMIFNLGCPKLYAFINFKKAIESEDYKLAANEMRKSNWYSQLPNRVERLAKEMETGGLK